MDIIKFAEQCEARELQRIDESIEPSRRATFRAATIGMRAYTIALRLRSLCPGIDFRGCSKRMIEDDFAQDGGHLRKFSGAQLRECLREYSA